MKERPILFNGPMVRAILAGHKTQTRRPIKGVPRVGVLVGDYTTITHIRDGEPVLGPTRFGAYTEFGDWFKPCPFGAPGDLLWVRETWRDHGLTGAGEPWRVEYRAGGWVDHARCPDPDHLPAKPEHWRPSILMPRWASRLTLRVVSVRAERLHDTCEDDIKAEGVHDVEEWPHVWGGAYSAPGVRWEDNPWVWVVEFERVTS